MSYIILNHEFNIQDLNAYLKQRYTNFKNSIDDKFILAFNVVLYNVLMHFTLREDDSLRYVIAFDGVNWENSTLTIFSTFSDRANSYDARTNLLKNIFEFSEAKHIVDDPTPVGYFASISAHEMDLLLDKVCALIETIRRWEKLRSFE